MSQTDTCFLQGVEEDLVQTFLCVCVCVCVCVCMFVNFIMQLAEDYQQHNRNLQLLSFAVDMLVGHLKLYTEEERS